MLGFAVLLEERQIFAQVFSDEILPEAFAQKEGSVDAPTVNHCGDETSERIDAAGCIDDFILQFYGAHLLWFVHDLAVASAPQALRDEAVFVRLVNRGAGDEIHRLNEDADDIVFDDEIREFFADSDGVVVCAKDEESAHLNAVRLDIFDGTQDFAVCAFFLVHLERFILEEFDAHGELEETGSFEEIEHFVVETDFVTCLYGEVVFDAAFDDGVEDRLGPFTVCEEIVVGDPQNAREAMVFAVEEIDGLPDVFDDRLRGSASHGSPKCGNQRAIGAVVGASAAGVNLWPDRVIDGGFFEAVQQRAVGDRVDLHGRNGLWPEDNFFAIFIDDARNLADIRTVFDGFGDHQDGFVTFTAHDDVGVCHGFFGIECGMQTAENDARFGFAADIVCELITSLGLEREDREKDDVGIQHIVPDNLGNRFAVAAHIVIFLMQNRGKRDDALRRRSNITVIYQMIQQSLLIRPIARFNKTNFHIIPAEIQI